MNTWFTWVFTVYELVVRRTNLTRVLFGLKPRPRPQVEPSVVVDRVAA